MQSDQPRSDLESEEPSRPSGSDWTRTIPNRTRNSLATFIELLQGSTSIRILGLRVTSVHLGVLVLAFVASFPLWSDNQVLLRTLIYILIYSILVLAMNIITGWTGQFSMAHAAFYGMGAYTSALLTVHLGIQAWLGMVAAAIVTAVAGVILGLPTLRLKGPYLALATIGFSQAFITVVINAVDVTRGPNGIVGIPRPMLGSFKFRTNGDYLYLILVLLILTILLVARLVNSRTGRAWIAIREDEEAARQMGIHTTFYKVAAFTISAALVGIMGSFYAHYMTFISPESFTVMESIVISSMMVLGGMGSIAGSILGAGLLLGVERAFSSVYDYRMIVYGAVLTGCVILRPQGLLGTRAAVLLSTARKRPEEKQMGTLLTRAAPGETSPRRKSFDKPTRVDLDCRPKILEVKGLKKSFGGLKAVDNLSFSVRQGEILSIIGPNGSGKTTAFNLIIGALAPDEGEILLDGESLVGFAPHQRVAKGLGRTFQEIRLFSNMTVEENVLVGQHARLKTGILGAVIRGPKARDEEARARENMREILGHFADRLLPRRNDFAVSLSYANRRRTEIARALGINPKVLMLDEPCAGMNPSERVEMAEIIQTLRQQGHTILVIEHHMGLVMEISDRVIVLDHGRCIYEGKPEEIQTNPEVALAYLGRMTEANRGKS